MCRVTADGELKISRLRLPGNPEARVCLMQRRNKMRNGASDAEPMRFIGQTVLRKQEKHARMENIDIDTNQPMILIGG